MLEEHDDELLAQLDFMKSKLEDAVEELGTMPISYVRTSTQGEQVFKRNAAFTAYEELLSAYCKALRTVRESVKDRPEINPAVIKFEQFSKSMRKHA